MTDIGACQSRLGKMDRASVPLVSLGGFSSQQTLQAIYTSRGQR
jgi:hypothetical protein